MSIFPALWTGTLFVRSNEIAARSLGLQPQSIRINGPTPDRAAVLQAMVDGSARERPDMFADFQSNAAPAIERHLPTMFPACRSREAVRVHS